MSNLDRLTVFPSARKLLEAGISCQSPAKGGWKFYWMEGGTELTLFPGGEGPQEMGSVEEAIEAIGGDQEAVLTPASLKRFGVDLQRPPALESLPTVESVWRYLEIDPLLPIPCSVTGCTVPSNWCETRKTANLVAAGYYYYCWGHAMQRNPKMTNPYREGAR